ncbi:MAG: hypothetical protein WD600_10465, partial [Pseudohongiella sp.]
EIAGCTLSGLISKAEEKLPEVRSFSPQQDQAFVRYPHLFQYYTKLIELQRSPAAVAERYNLDDLSTYLYLRKLEDLGLLELQADNRVKIPEVAMTFGPDSRFVRKGVAWSLEQATRALLDHDNQASNVTMLFLPEKHCDELLEEISKVFLRFADRQLDTYWENLWQGDVRQLVLFSYPVTSKYPEYDVIRVRDGDLR